MTFNNNADTIAVASNDNSIKLFDAAVGTKLAEVCENDDDDAADNDDDNNDNDDMMQL